MNHFILAAKRYEELPKVNERVAEVKNQKNTVESYV